MLIELQPPVTQDEYDTPVEITKLNPLQVLVVEENDEIRELLCTGLQMTLGPLGYRIDAADNYSTAVALVGELNPAHLVVEPNTSDTDADTNLQRLAAAFRHKQPPQVFGFTSRQLYSKGHYFDHFAEADKPIDIPLLAAQIDQGPLY